jgi:catechol 2,3-dioxygenase-like lactoylglutathione lyase family enzyme
MAHPNLSGLKFEIGAKMMDASAGRCSKEASMSRSGINGIAPFFMVRNAEEAVAFYRDKLGFEVMYQGPEGDNSFGMVGRDGAMLMVKAVGVNPEPNSSRHPWARWDAYVSVVDPDALAEEFTLRGVVFSVPLKDTEDGLRGFEVKDVDGYVLFFGHPRVG